MSRHAISVRELLDPPGRDCLAASRICLLATGVRKRPAGRANSETRIWQGVHASRPHRRRVLVAVFCCRCGGCFGRRRRRLRPRCCCWRSRRVSRDSQMNKTKRGTGGRRTAARCPAQATKIGLAAAAHLIDSAHSSGALPPVGRLIIDISRRRSARLAASCSLVASRAAAAALWAGRRSG
jgi:hypothetical protein